MRHYLGRQKLSVMNKVCLCHRDLSGCGCGQRRYCGEEQSQQGELKYVKFGQKCKA